MHCSLLRKTVCAKQRNLNNKASAKPLHFDTRNHEIFSLRCYLTSIHVTAKNHQKSLENQEMKSIEHQLKLVHNERLKIIGKKYIVGTWELDFDNIQRKFYAQDK